DGSQMTDKPALPCPRTGWNRLPASFVLAYQHRKPARVRTYRRWLLTRESQRSLCAYP
ncbi:hypothetical protein SK128_024606, partial [Halocaridina rubra]